jgi:hypothetical protein
MADSFSQYYIQGTKINNRLQKLVTKHHGYDKLNAEEAMPKMRFSLNDEILTAKIALAHLSEFPDYYTRLNKLEKEAEDYWK